jgi:DNA-binding HxlR family transcriptional regulator
MHADVRLCYYEIKSFDGRWIVARVVEKAGTVCPVSRSLDVVGDRWSMLVLRELYMGAARFEEIQIQTEATPQMLATRLKSLEADGMIERQPYSEKPLRYEYRLTEKGRDSRVTRLGGDVVQGEARGHRGALRASQVRPRCRAGERVSALWRTRGAKGPGVDAQQPVCQRARRAARRIQA